MFADIVGSTRLYEILGDECSEELISKTLGQLSKIIGKAGGEIIKTIGDEVMCRFAKAEEAITAARLMHEYLAKKPAPSRDYKIAIRVGAHQGPIIESDGDVFGDTVNISARIAGLARAGKTMITGYTHDNLSAATRERCRHFTRTTVKGKELPIDVFDVVWEQTDELTRVVGASNPAVIGNILTIQFGDSIIRLSANAKTSATLGRSEDCDLVVPSPHASREHCRIEFNRGKFILNDNSANGSYVIHNQAELLFHQERVPLLGEGMISLGAPSEMNSDYLLNYSIEGTDSKSRDGSKQ
jgi:hypothetical protein